MRLLFLFCLQIFILRVVTAQRTSLHFENITTKNGLSHNKVNCIKQDARGFIWIGTNDGLNRYDGKHFVIYKNVPGNSSTLSGNIITDLLEDKQGVLWIATADGGLTRHDYRLPSGQQFRQYRHQPGDSNSIPVNLINKIVEDDDGFLWLATSGFYLLRFDKTTERFLSPVNRGTKTVLALSKRKADEIWAGRQGGGLLTLNPRTLSFSMDSRYEDLYNKTLPHVTVISLFTDSRHNTWFGSWDRVLYKYTASQNTKTAYTGNRYRSDFLPDEILAFAEDTNRQLWMGGKTMGLQIFNPVTETFTNYQHDPAKSGSLADNHVNCIFTDRSGLVWIGTDRGISLSNPWQQQFRQHFLSHDNREAIRLFDFFESPGGKLWIGTNKGIFIKPGIGGEFMHVSLNFKGKTVEATKFYRSCKGELFLGTNYSLFRLNEQNFELTQLPNTDKDSVVNQIIRSQIVSICEDTLFDEPALVVSPYGHFLAYYIWSKQKWVSRLDTSANIIETLNLRDNLIRKLYKSPSSGKLFLATAKTGLGMWEEEKKNYFTFYKNNPAKTSLSNNDVTDMVEDQHGNIWITTFGGGLHYYNSTEKTVTHIPESNNLLESVQLDKFNRVWMVSNGNVDRYDPKTKIYTSFPLPDVENTGGISGKIFKDSKGILYVTGTNYFIPFDPATIAENRSPLPVYITNFSIHNQSYSHLINNGDLQLAYDQNYITIEYAAPEFDNNTPVEYQYCLEGLQPDWTDLGTENKVSFSNLAGGSYTFRLRATNMPGVWYELDTPLQFIITPPFWKTWWFYLLASTTLAALVYSIYRYRINEILKRQAIRNKIAQDLHDNVGSTLSSIGVYSQVAKIYQEQNRNDQLKDTLGKISETASNMISEMSDIVWTINPRNDNMSVILQRMESFAKPLLAARNIILHFDVDPALRQVSLEMTQRKNFYLIFKESVNNALKYADCRNFYVSITMEQARIKMVITDDGAGFDKLVVDNKIRHSLSGNGLNNMQMRAKEIKGGFVLFSNPGNGTTIKLEFPIT